MNYGFLVGVAILGLALGVVGYIAALGERRAALERLRLAEAKAPASSPMKSVIRGAVYVVNGAVRSEAMIRAMGLADKLPANQAVSGERVGERLATVYQEMWKKRTPAQPMKS